jgi:hypothetical protein
LAAAGVELNLVLALAVLFGGAVGASAMFATTAMGRMADARVGRPAAGAGLETCGRRRCGVGRPAHSHVRRCGVGRPAHSQAAGAVDVAERAAQAAGRKGQNQCYGRGDDGRGASRGANRRRCTDDGAKHV